MTRAFRVEYEMTMKSGFTNRTRNDVVVGKPHASGAKEHIEYCFNGIGALLVKKIVDGKPVVGIKLSIDEIDPKDAVLSDQQCEPDWSPLG